MTQTNSELLACRKCGAIDYTFWSGAGTQADLVCNSCGMEENVQCSDVFDYGDPRRHAPLDPKTYMNPQDVIDAVNKHLTNEWNQRSIAPPTATPAPTADEVEKVARAIVVSLFKNAEFTDEEIKKSSLKCWTEWKPEAKAAIAAMRPAVQDNEGLIKECVQALRDIAFGEIPSEWNAEMKVELLRARAKKALLTPPTTLPTDKEIV